VEALRALHHDGDLRPTAPRVAARAGVSLRTVWQHFSDLETLFVAAGRRDEQIARSFLQPIDAGLSLAQRIDQLVEQRASMYEEMAPVWRAARLQEPFSAQIRKNHDRLLALGRAQLEAVFDRELAGTGAGRRELLAALQVVTVWPAWESLRVDLKLTAAQAGNVMASTLVALLGKGPG
jgi:AcrR family transcriptional regulator